MNWRRLIAYGSVWLAATTLTAIRSSSAEAPDDELVRMVIELLADKDKDVRAIGLEQIRSEAKGSAATRQFAATLPKLSPEAQTGLLSALADRGDKTARPAVLEVLASSRNELARAAAIEALGTLGEPADLPVLIQHLESQSKAEKAAARNSLTRLSGQGVSKSIAAALKASSPAVRVSLVEILVARRAFDTVPALLPLALDEDPRVRSASLKALGQLAGPEQLREVIPAVLKAEKGPPREAAEKAVAAICGRIVDVDKRAEPLLASIGSLSAEDRTAMLPTLGRVGGPAALAAIEMAIADSDPQRHEAGVRALCNWPDATIAPRLLELVQSDKNPAEQALVLGALIRVAPLPDKRSNEQKLELLQELMPLCTSDEQRRLAVKRASAIRSLETLHFLLPYLDDPALAQQAAESIVELAHHRGLREPNKAEFNRALDRVIATSKDAVVVDRANRYKRNQTWVRAAAPARGD